MEASTQPTSCSRVTASCVFCARIAAVRGAPICSPEKPLRAQLGMLLLVNCSTCHHRMMQSFPSGWTSSNYVFVEKLQCHHWHFRLLSYVFGLPSSAVMGISAAFSKKGLAC
mmetsp:Transcript_143548/g.459098  ORF Transcript_143548/g.459098 Transcript_143548/m.459098 type:complete len:112 (-) Transcript_143548:2223-2558(-)